MTTERDATRRGRFRAIFPLCLSCFNAVQGAPSLCPRLDGGTCLQWFVSRLGPPSGLLFTLWALLGQQGSDGPVPEPSPDLTVHCREEGLM